MKKNLLLSIILVGLIIFTYFFQELGSEKRREKLELKNRIVHIPTDQIDVIELKNTKLLSVKGQWMVGDLDYPASAQQIHNLFQHIQNIHQIKTLPSDKDEQYFANQGHEIVFSSMGKEWKYRLGDVSEITGNFYFQDSNTTPSTIYLARDTSEFSGFYKTELELLLNKYLNFKDLILATPAHFIDRNLFIDIDLKSVTSIKIDNKWNRWFEIDLINKKTNPEVMKGLHYGDLNEILTGKLNKVKIEKLVSRNDNVLKSPVCTIELKTNDNKTHILNVFPQAGNEVGLFVTKDSMPKWIFKLKTEGRDFFFSNVQKYWDKKLFYPDDLKNLKRLDFKVGDKKNLYTFYVENVDEFEIKSDDERVESIHKANTNFLFHLLFSLTKFKQANAVFEKLPSLGEVLLKLNVQILEQDIEIVFTKDKVYIVNKSDNIVLEYLFPAGDYKLNSLQDFFALK